MKKLLIAVAATVVAIASIAPAASADDLSDWYNSYGSVAPSAEYPFGGTWFYECDIETKWFAAYLDDSSEPDQVLVESLLDQPFSAEDVVYCATEDPELAAQEAAEAADPSEADDAEPTDAVEAEPEPSLPPDPEQPVDPAPVFLRPGSQLIQPRAV